MLAASIINTITDWVVVLLPIWVALGLNLPIRQVGIVIFLFGLGILASSAGIVRSYYAWILAFHSDDIKNRRDVWLTSIVELNLGIVCEWYRLYIEAPANTITRYVLLFRL